jgi:trk system potassium uptake protein TrkA
MDSVDLAVLRRARDWLRDGHPVVLYTVLETWGSAPRPIGSLLAHVVAVHSLRRGAAEALELVVHGDRKTSKVVGRRVDEIKLPEGAMIGAIVRHSEKPIRVEVTDLAVRETHEQVIMPHHDTVIEPEDHVIVFCSTKRVVARVEGLFQVGFGFL